MNKLCCFIILLVGSGIKPIEAQVFEKAKSYVTIGYGFVIVPEPSQAPGIDHTTYIKGPFYGKYEFSITDKFGIGVNLSYLNFILDIYQSDYEYGQTVEYYSRDNYSGFSSLIRANWHSSGSNNRVGIYGGFGMGYRTAKWEYHFHNTMGAKEDKTTYDNHHFGFEATGGIKVMFSKIIGAYAEFGIAKSVFQFGLTGKF